jgi:hypothetical protein
MIKKIKKGLSRKMTKKEIEMFDVEIKFMVRKGSHESHTPKELKENIVRGIGGNDMNCIEAEDITVKIK